MSGARLVRAPGVMRACETRDKGRARGEDEGRSVHPSSLSMPCGADPMQYFIARRMPNYDEIEGTSESGQASESRIIQLIHSSRTRRWRWWWWCGMAVWWVVVW
jgi:hypothetical protein